MRGLLLVGAGAWIGLASGASAQSSPAPAPAADTPSQAGAKDNANEIVVTATRRPESDTSVPVAVTALSSQQLDSAVIRDTQDLARIAPGLVITTAASEATAATIRLRGVGTSGTNLGLEGSVGVFVDGVYRARSGIALTDLFDIAQVEVLRGPQGTLFGKNTTAGALIVRTNQPSFDWSGQAIASYGNRDAVRLAVAGGGPLSDVLAFRVAANFNRKDGYLRDVGTGREVNDRNRFAVRGQVLFQPSADIGIRLIVDHARKDEQCCGATVIANGTRAPAIAALGGFVPTVFDDYTVANNRKLSAETRESGLSAEANVKLGAVDWNTILSWRHFRSHRSVDSDFTNLDLINTPFEDTTDRFITGETTLRGRTGPVDWLIGAFAFDQRTRQDGALTYGSNLQAFFQRVFPAAAALLAGRYPVGGGDVRRDYGQDASGWSLFTHNIVEVAPGVKLTGGLRYLKEEKDGFGTFAFNSPSCGVVGIPIGAQQLCPVPNYTASFSDDKLVGTGALSFEPLRGTLLYASYSKGYKAGGINLDRSTGSGVIAGRTFRPEEVDSYEVGLKARFLDSRARAALTWFHSDIRNFQQNAFTGVAFVISNAAEVRSRGVEIEASVQPIRGVTLGSSLVYNKATYGSATADATLRGRQIVNAPRWTYQGQVGVEQPVGGGWSVFGNGNLRRLSGINTSVSLIPQAQQGAYTLVGGRLGIRSPNDRWELALFGQNLTDEYYRTIVFAGVIQPGTFNAYVGEPRTVGLEARVKF